MAHQVDPSQILSQSKGLLLKTISQMSRRVLSSSQLRQVMARVYWILTDQLLASLTFTGSFAPAARPLCRPGPRGDCSSHGAPRPGQPQPGDGLRLSMFKILGPNLYQQQNVFNKSAWVKPLYFIVMCQMYTWSPLTINSSVWSKIT